MDADKTIALNLEDLDEVSGGARVSESSRLKEFTKAWKALKFQAHGYTSHLMQALFEEWKSAGYKPATAKKFLKKFVKW